MLLWRVLLWRAGHRPACDRTAGALSGPAALLVSVALGACSTTGAGPKTAGWFAAVPATSSWPAVKIEADGIEAQRPPRRRSGDVPDDPAEPFSPNYGTLSPNGEAEAAPAPA